MTTKSVLLCGGPADGHRVDVTETATSYVWTQERPRRPLSVTDGWSWSILLPEYDRTVYRLSIALTRTGQQVWVGFPVDCSSDEADRVVTRTLLAEESLRETYTTTYTDQRTRTVETTMAYPTASRPASTDLDRRRTETIKELYRLTAVPLVQIVSIYDRAVQDVKAPTSVEPVKDDGLTHMTISSRKPDKWRFLDTETGETWRWDTEGGKFVKVVYPK